MHINRLRLDDKSFCSVKEIFFIIYLTFDKLCGAMKGFIDTNFKFLTLLVPPIKVGHSDEVS